MTAVSMSPAIRSMGRDYPTTGRSQTEELQTYLNRLTRFPLLTAAQEVTLARQIAEGGVRGERAKSRLIECNMRLVISVAKSYRASRVPLEDLIQEGAIGLMTAAERYDAARGCRFSTYATQWIRQAIGRAVENKSRCIRLPAHISEALKQLERARTELRRELGEEPTTEQLADRTGLTSRKVHKLLNMVQEPVSLDAPVGAEETTSLGAILHDQTSPDPPSALLETETRFEIQEILASLDEREQAVMRMRFGFEGEEAAILQTIGERLCLSRERVRQIEVAAIRKLRKAIRPYFPEP